MQLFVSLISSLHWQMEVFTNSHKIYINLQFNYDCYHNLVGEQHVV